MRHPASLILALLLVLVFVAPSPSWGQSRGQRRRAAPSTTAPNPADRGVRVQYAGVELTRVIQDIGTATGTRFIYGDDVRGVVTITVAKLVSKDEALELLRAALFMKGFAQLPAGDHAFKIVPIAESSSSSAFTQRDLDRRSERSITTLYTLEYTDANTVAETVKTLAPSSGAVVAYSPTNSLLLTGTESALGRLLEIVRVIDDAASEDLIARVIRYRDVGELVEMADEALNTGWPRASQIEFFDDARTNMLLARGSPERLAELREFIETFDRFEMGRGRINVVRVLNRDPEEIVDLLRSLQSGEEVVEAGPDDGTNAEAVDLVGDSLAGQAFQLTVDAPTRSIIVQAEPSVGELVAGVIAELDRIPPRVSVEIFFYEVQRPSGYLLAFDFSSLIGAQGQDDLAFAVSNKPSGSRVPSGPQGDPVTGQSGLFGRMASDPVVINITDPNTGITIPITIPTNEVAVEASAGNIRLDLLSRPNLVVTSGDEHELFVGNNIPIPVTSGNAGVASDGTADVATINPLVQQQTIERVDVGTMLRVRPTVGVEGGIELGITLEFSDVTRSKAGDPRDVGVTLLQRTIESTATVRPGEYLILGMQDERSTRYVKTGIPWLMNVPGIGLLFSRTEEQRIDTQILMAVKARLLRSAADEIAETVRRRMALERSLSRVADLAGLDETPWAVRMATFEYRPDAQEVADAFEGDGFVTRVTRWEGASRVYWDVYLTGYSSFEEASIVAAQAVDAEWEGEVLLLPAINEMAPPS